MYVFQYLLAADFSEGQVELGRFRGDGAPAGGRGLLRLLPDPSGLRFPEGFHGWEVDEIEKARYRRGDFVIELEGVWVDAN